jgi:hypothetical protein
MLFMTDGCAPTSWGAAFEVTANCLVQVKHACDLPAAALAATPALQ